MLVCCEWFDERGFGQALAARGHAVHLPKRIEWQAVVRLPPSGRERLGVPIHYAPHSAAEGVLRISRAIFHAVREFEPHVVHLHGLWTGMIGLVPWFQRQGCKVVVSPHGMASADLRHLSRGFKKWASDATFHKWGLRRVDHFHALNTFEVDALRSYLGRRELPVSIVPNGIEPAAPPPKHTRGQVARFLYCGRLHPGKNVIGLLKGFQRAALGPGAQLLIAGDGDGEYAAQVRAYAQAVPGVVLLGHVDSAKKTELLRSADYSVLFSKSEGQPMATLEGLAFGLPPIVSTTCRMTEAARASGWLVQNEAELALAFAEATRLEASAYAERSIAALRFAQEEHSWPLLGEKMAQLYEQLRSVSVARVVEA